MLRVLVQGVRVRDLDDVPEVHDRDPVGDVPDDPEIVRDEEVREVEVLLQALEEVQDLRLDRDVERRHGLVAHDQLRVRAQGPRDPDALALAARELVWVAVVVLGVQPDPTMSSRTRRFVSPSVLWIAKGSPMICPTVWRGLSEA